MGGLWECPQAESWGRRTYGQSYYAPAFLHDAKGRPCRTFWMQGVADLRAGCATEHSIPHVLTLDGETSVAAPHPDLDPYRTGVAEDVRLPDLADYVR